MPAFFSVDMLETLFVRVRWVYLWRFKDRWMCPPVVRPYSVFWLIEKGSALVSVGDERYTAGPGHLVFIPPNTVLAAELSPNVSQFQYFSVGLDLKLGSVDVFHLYDAPRHVTIASPSVMRRLQAIGNRCARIAEGLYNLPGVAQDPAVVNVPPPSHDAPKTLSTERMRLNALIRMWLSEVLDLMDSITPLRLLGLDQQLIGVLEYIHENLSGDLSSQKLAKVACTSESNLSPLFQKNLGLSPQEYVRKVRIAHAADLLLWTDLSIKEIAVLSGYPDPRYFSRVFKQALGCTPSEYRLRNEAEGSAVQTAAAAQ